MEGYTAEELRALGKSIDRLVVLLERLAPLLERAMNSPYIRRMMGVR